MRALSIVRPGAIRPCEAQPPVLLTPYRSALCGLRAARHHTPWYVTAMPPDRRAANLTSKPRIWSFAYDASAENLVRLSGSRYRSLCDGIFYFLYHGNSGWRGDLYCQLGTPWDPQQSGLRNISSTRITLDRSDIFLGVVGRRGAMHRTRLCGGWRNSGEINARVNVVILTGYSLLNCFDRSRSSGLKLPTSFLPKKMSPAITIELTIAVHREKS